MSKAIATSALVLVLTGGACVTASSSNAPVRAKVAAVAADTFEVGMLRVEHRGTPGRTPIVFIPALFCGAWQWEREIAALSDRYDIYALTLPGFDGRPRDTGGDLMNRAASDLSRLIKIHRIDRPIVVGHSLGGTLAVLFAELHRGDARGIVAVEGGYPVASTAAQREQQVAASVAPYVGLGSGQALGAALRTNMLQYVITSKADVDNIERLAARSDPAAVEDWMRAALLLDLSPGLRDIPIALTEIVPSDSVIDPYRGFASETAKRAVYEKWLAQAPHGSVMMIPRSRHFVMLDQPSEFDRALYAAIERDVARAEGRHNESP
jgi:pimeloyl-ACP methyl ester carboxylesterase